MNKFWKIAIAVIVVVSYFVFCVVSSLADTAAKSAYAEAHNCEWSATGTFYGDDRDYICK